MTRSVMNHPRSITSTVDALMKYQLASGLTVRCGSISCAAVCVNPWSSGSMPDGMKLALNPPETPAKAATIPAIGWRPAV